MINSNILTIYQLPSTKILFFKHKSIYSQKKNLSSITPFKTSTKSITLFWIEKNL